MSFQEPLLTRGLYLEVQFGPNEAVVRHAGRIPHAPHSLARKPILKRLDLAAVEAEASELVLYVLDSCGEVLDSFGWPYSPASWFDRPGRSGSPDSHAPLLIGRVRRSLGGVRVMRIPHEEGGTYLCMTRGDIKLGSLPGQFVYAEHPLSVFVLGPSAPPALPSALTKRFGPLTATPLEIDEDPLLRASLRCPAKLGARVEDGFVGLATPAVPVDRGFNIVVLGDGFADNEQQGFLDLANMLVYGSPGVDGLNRIEPFKGVWKTHINVRFVQTVSAQSGITFCSDRSCSNAAVVHRNTYYELEGCFGGSDYPGFVGAANPDLIRAAAEHAFPKDFTHLYVVLANCPMSGGHADSKDNIVYLPRWSDDSDAQFVQAAAHECGHVIAGLADEYIACWPKASDMTHPNQATLEQVDTDTVPWAWQATTREYRPGIGGNRHLRAIDRWDQPLVGSKRDWLGAFWGCLNIDADQPEDLNTCQQWSDPRGRSFFRPMDMCRMRDLTVEFCEVCEWAVKDAIVATCGNDGL